MTENDVKICGHGSGRPSIKNMYTYTKNRYANKAPNGKHKGIVCVRRLRAMTDEGRKKFIQCYNEIIGRNYYSQNKRGYVYTKYKDGKYYSDCSSSGMAAMKRAGFNVGSWLINTAGIYESKLFDTVPVKIVNGHITNPEVLKVADCILYMGNDPSRPKQIGHVEYVYQMPGNSSKDEKPTGNYTGAWPSLSNGRSDSTGHGYYKVGDGIDTLKNYPTQIKRVQTLLNWINDDNITIDGKYGTQTRKACDAAQKRLGLMVTGIFDYSLLKAAKKHFK